MQSQKITALHKKFKAEIAQYKDKVQQLEQSAGMIYHMPIFMVTCVCINHVLFSETII